jgi:hypothetical protein
MLGANTENIEEIETLKGIIISRGKLDRGLCLVSSVLLFAEAKG